MATNTGAPLYLVKNETGDKVADALLNGQNGNADKLSAEVRSLRATVSDVPHVPNGRFIAGDVFLDVPIKNDDVFLIVGGGGSNTSNTCLFIVNKVTNSPVMVTPVLPHANGNVTIDVSGVPANSQTGVVKISAKYGVTIRALRLG